MLLFFHIKAILMQLYANVKMHMLSDLGLGNEAIIMRALAYVKTVSDPILCVMMTNVDKWDWYISNAEQYNKYTKEHHTIKPIHDNDIGGFWSTGSWFPLEKEYYKKHYYDLNYQIIHTLSLINLLTSYCELNDIPLVLLFDSPVYDCLEQELNKNPKDLPKHAFNLCPTAKPFFKLISNINVYEPGLIGFCVKNNIPWYHNKFKGHPGSLAHYLFAEEHIFPRLDKLLSINNYSAIDEARKMNKIWNLTNEC